jgi:hypothetical protein
VVHQCHSRRHAFKEPGQQHTLWVKIEEATPHQMHVSAQARRKGVLMDVLQIDRDLGYFNNHHNPGDPIQMSWDFNADVDEQHMPTEYPDAPPDDQPLGE